MDGKFSRSTRAFKKKVIKIILENLSMIENGSLKALLLSKSVAFHFCRNDQDLILRGDRNMLIRSALSLWYSVSFWEELSRLLAKKKPENTLSPSLNKTIHNYFNEEERMVYDRSKKKLLLVCDSFYDSFSKAQLDEVLQAAYDATKVDGRDIEGFGHCNVAAALSILQQVHYETSQQESLIPTEGTEELCTLVNHGHRTKRKVKMLPDDSSNMKCFFEQVSPSSSPIQLLILENSR